MTRSFSLSCCYPNQCATQELCWSEEYTPIRTEHLDTYYVYDDLGRTVADRRNGTDNLKTDYAYHIRNWMTAIESPLFREELHYTDGTGTPCYNGNISSISWKAGEEQTTRGYRFTYDGMERMKMAEYGEGERLAYNQNRFNEEVTDYDKMGNILGIRRMGKTGAQEYGLVDNLSLTYKGNQLTKVTDNAAGSAYTGGFEFKDGADKETEYTYDENGNLTQDLNRNIEDIQYNFLNLPETITFGDGSKTEYLYDANGRKLRTVHKADGKTTTTEYAGNLIYENGNPVRLITGYGYVSLPDGMYHYYLQDHQGNNRVVADQTGKVEEVNHYYPFGGMFTNTGNVQPYKYNGKEIDTRKGLYWYDYGARHYDPALGRWHVQDPMQEKYYNTSQYAYCMNNPIRFVDPNGMDGVYIAFPDYKISTPIGKISNLGHAGVLLINNSTGETKYYEYGRYDSEGKGIVRNISVPNVKIDSQGKPTLESLNKTMEAISKKAGHGGRIEGAYIESNMYEKMKRYAESQKSENNNPERKEYSLLNNNCGTFAIDVLNQDTNVKKDAPKIVDPRPVSIVEEYQETFTPISYNEKNNQTFVREK